MNFSHHPVSSLLYSATSRLFGALLFAVTLCVVFPFFLVIVAIGIASAGAYALASQRDERRGKFRGARERARLSSFNASAGRTLGDKNSAIEKHS